MTKPKINQKKKALKTISDDPGMFELILGTRSCIAYRRNYKRCFTWCGIFERDPNESKRTQWFYYRLLPKSPRPNAFMQSESSIETVNDVNVSWKKKKGHLSVTSLCAYEENVIEMLSLLI